MPARHRLSDSCHTAGMALRHTQHDHSARMPTGGQTSWQLDSGWPTCAVPRLSVSMSPARCGRYAWPFVPPSHIWTLRQIVRTPGRYHPKYGRYGDPVFWQRGRYQRRRPKRNDKARRRARLQRTEGKIGVRRFLDSIYWGSTPIFGPGTMVLPRIRPGPG